MIIRIIYIPFLNSMSDITLIISYDILQRKDLRVYGVNFTIKSYKELANNNYIINLKDKCKDNFSKNSNYPIVITNPEFNDSINPNDAFNYIQLAYIKYE